LLFGEIVSFIVAELKGLGALTLAIGQVVAQLGVVDLIR